MLTGRKLKVCWGGEGRLIKITRQASKRSPVFDTYIIALPHEIIHFNQQKLIRKVKQDFAPECLNH